MAKFTFKKANKSTARARIALIGGAGSGKTYSALQLATELADGKPCCVIDTERGSAAKYSDLFDFSTLELDKFDPDLYTQAIKDAEEAGFAVIVIDSMSHAWSGSGGALQQAADNTSRGGNSFSAWKTVTPKVTKFMDAILSSKCHVISTFRTKMEYLTERDEKTGKNVIRKLGMEPIFKDQSEYEFDIVVSLNQDNDLIITKTRCPSLTDMIFHRDAKELGGLVKAWLSDGVAYQKDQDKAKAEMPAAQDEQHEDSEQQELSLFDRMVMLIESATDTKDLYDRVGKEIADNVAKSDPNRKALLDRFKARDAELKGK